VDTLAGNSMLMRRAVIDQIGFLDPAYVAYYEETDWCARAIRADHDLLYEPAAVIAHREQGSATTAYHAYHMTRNQLRFALKNVELARLPRALILDLWAIAIDGARAMRAQRAALVPVLLSAVLWNVLNLRATRGARRHDAARLGPGARPYLASLPLRSHTADGRGGLRPPLDTARGPGAHPTKA
ncbi:MAG: glycosyltransferase family 2 protein, partial [Chloroflexi bacterium]|nr:glycosyltransferase family 2 protein [Chloroflexota bacterium]